MSLLSVDILHQVFKFFVSNNQTVDGESIRVASLVCKQWRDVVDSRLLWETPARIEEHHGNRNGDDEGDENCRLCTVHQSLQIKEMIGVSSIDQNSLQSSLIGFVNLKRYGRGLPELYFFVRERVTGFRFLLSISRNGHISPSIIRDLYVNHFELKEEFLRRDRNNGPDNFFPPQQFPLGISVWRGRVLRWYRSGTETEATSMIEQISPKRKDLLHQQIYHLTESEKTISLVRHLLDLEKASLGDRDNNESYRYEGRQHMIDWIVEISECFDLEDRTIFQAMLLFDRFIASADQRVKTSLFQLVTGACVSIASKCNKVYLTEKDISFCCDNKFPVASIVATEKLILNQLEWRLACPSSIDFITAFSKIFCIGRSTRLSDARMSCLYCYIAELSLAFDTSYIYPPSLIAASAMVLAHYSLRLDNTVTLWPKELAHATGFQLKDDLVECSVQLSKDAEKIRLSTVPRISSRLDMIYRRYSKPCRRSVAEITIPVLTSTTILTAYEARLR
uniref:Cyclin-F n=1 Tax=Pseudo-nitzschia australis TaxID=44445 RepID=A0A7S4AAB1_9STRA|mmetsp:Transcript_26471/g.58000  ORF Transcript_26471/g.58000 Transcript_26471/m.58000 type:complete len:507 (-) Transcript_26471:43-1563(-)